MIIDLHTHSTFSPDANEDVETMIKSAIRKGVTHFAITDHCECNFWDDAPSPDVRDSDMYGSKHYAKASIYRLTDMKMIYRGLINLFCGIELGQPLQNPEAAEMIVSDKRLDFIIGSHHMNEGCDDFYWLEYKNMDTSEIVDLLDDYFSQVLEMCRWGKFDVLGHLTYPLRYIYESGRLDDLDMKRWEELIREIFRTLIKNDKGIEVNTSGLRQPIGRTLPDLEYVKLWHDMGGRIITVGSDAHCAKDIGAGIEQGLEVIKRAGFEHVNYFFKRQIYTLEI